MVGKEFRQAPAGEFSVGFDLQHAIEKARERAGISLREMAARIGVSPGTLSRFERHDDDHLGEEKIVALANALGVSVQLLWDVIGHRPPKRLGTSGDALPRAFYAFKKLRESGW